MMDDKHYGLGAGSNSNSQRRQVQGLCARRVCEHHEQYQRMEALPRDIPLSQLQKADGAVLRTAPDFRVYVAKS